MPRKAMCASHSLVVYLLLLPALVKCCRQTPRKSKIGLHLNGPRKPYSSCKPNPCKNGATCNGAGVDYSCTCRSNYEGKRCDSFNACKSNPCKNKATCNKNGRGFQCTCPFNYEGSTCEYVDPCGSHPCAHGGTCTKKGRSFTCKCQSGFNGAKCEEVDPCGSHPCAHGGTCTTNGRSFMCKCQPGFHGAKCEAAGCSPNPCKNGGSCYSDGDSFYCFCAQNFRGDTCEEFEPCYTNPCLNSGTCVATETSSTCLCPKNFRGQKCETFDPCFFIPCHKSSKCVSTGHPNKGNGSWSAHCECDGYHKGDLCESEDNMCQLTDRPDCISECSAAEDGTYILCENCRKYAVCNGGKMTEKSCPDKPFWGFNKETRQCQYKSPDCFECSDPCKHSPCQGGGTCIPYIARYECTCAEERAGNLCQFDKSQCTPNPCQNGGECVVDGTYNATLHYVVYWECFCQMGYSGDTCEQCLGVFKQIGNKRCPGGDPLSNTVNLEECKQQCMDISAVCAGIDYVNDTCYLHYKNECNRNKLVDKLEHIHYYILPC